MLQLGIQSKGCAIKGLVVCNIWLESRAFGYAERQALGCYQPSPEVLTYMWSKLICLIMAQTLNVP